MSNSRLIQRQNAMITVYIHLIRDMEISEIIADNHFVTSVSDFSPKIELDEELLDVVNRVSDRKEIYERAMNQYLNKWRFDRLGYIEQAILLVACAELELGHQEKPIIINEAVRLAKLYAEEDSYKLINGVIDAI